MLENIVRIVKKLKNLKHDHSAIKGRISELSEEDINNILTIENNIEECFDLENNTIGKNKEDLLKYRNKTIEIQIYVGNCKDYFESFPNFIARNKIELKCQEDFYIQDIDYWHKKGQEYHHEELKNYSKNLQLINLLKSIADYEKTIGSDLELFFYKSDKGLTLKIDYEARDLEGLEINKLQVLRNHFYEKPDTAERKQIFVNEIIHTLNNDSSYSNLLKKWVTIIDNYDKSFKLYLDGFSFEKIKNSSTIYFQELTDRIYDQINKASTNIYIVPAAYLFLLKSFELSGGLLENIFSLVTAFL